jgi:outer membrane protein
MGVNFVIANIFRAASVHICKLKRDIFGTGRESYRNNCPDNNPRHTRLRRNLNLVCLGIIINILPAALPVNAQQQESDTITITQAIQMAMKRNYNLRQLATNVAMSKDAVNQAISPFLPDISISANGSKYFVPKAEQQVAGGETVSAQLSGSLNLFNGFGDIASLREARSKYWSAEANYAYNRQQLIFNTISQYLQVLETRDFMKVAQQNLVAQKQELQLIEEFKKQGNKAITDVLQQQATVQQAQLQLLTATQNYQVNRVTLLETLGQYPTANPEFASFDVNVINASLDKRKPFEENDTIFKDRQDIISQMFQLEAARAGVKAAEAGFWPSLSLFANLSSNYNSLDKQYGFGEQFSRNRVGTIGLSLSIPIFDRLVTLFNVEDAKEEVDYQNLLLEGMRLSASSQYRQAVLAYKTAIEQQISAEAQYKYSQEALQAVEAKYKVGSATYVDLSLAQSQYLTSNYDLVAAEYNKLLQYLTVLYQQGNIEQSLYMLDRKSGQSK